VPESVRTIEFVKFS